MLLLALLACGSEPAPSPVVHEIAAPEAVAFELSAAVTAEAPHLTATEGGLVLSWWETEGEASVLRASVINTDGVQEPVEVKRAGDALINFADVPTVSNTPRGWLATWPGHLGEGYAYDVVVGASADAGTWTDLGAAHDDKTASEHGFASVAFDAEKTWLFWLDGRNTVAEGPMGLRVAEVGSTVGASVVIDERVCDCCGTDAVITAKGPIVAYRDRTEAEVRDVHVARLGADGWTGGPVASDAWTIKGCPVNGPALDARGERVSMAWYTEGGGPRVRLVQSITSGVEFSEPVDIATGESVLGRVDVAQLSDGRSVVSWLEKQDDEVARVLARVVDGDKLGEPILVGETTPGRASGFPVLGMLDGVILWVWTVPEQGLRAATISLDAI